MFRNNLKPIQILNLRSRVFIRITLLGFVLSLLFIPISSSAEDTQLDVELKIKAAFIYNFFKFVEWPDKALGDADGTISICILGKDPFGELFDPVKGSNVLGKRLLVRNISSLKNMDDCHILFVSSSERDKLSSIITYLGKSSVLTVSEIDDFARRGGIIGFYKKENNIRFKINLGAANSAGLKISSKLLELAKIVE